MLRYLYGDELHHFSKLRDSMFRDRAAQFSARLGWSVSVDENGFETDEYDAENPLYVIWQRADGRHGGSMRFLPTIGETMINAHFSHLTDGVKIRHPLIWESTRFCLAEAADSRVSAALMLGGLDIGLNFHLSDCVGVFDARMQRVYGRLGWAPTILGRAGNGRNAISAGLWRYDPALRPGLLKKSGLSDALSRRWFDAAFAAAAAPLARVG